MEEIRINREHKDRLFRLLFGDEKNRTNLLSLYNAINHTDYTNAEDMEITTMQDCIYMRMKNDVSVLLYQVLALYEQQSSWNPNMPLRGLLYFAHLYEKYVETHKLNIYGSRLLQLPTPQYIVFYNGTDRKTEEVKLRLSDSFEIPCNGGGFEWTATVKNINYGYNKELMENCRILKEYAQFVDKVRQYRKELGDITAAAERTIQECINEGILEEFLAAHRAEVLDVCLTEYNEELVMEALKKDSREEGLEQGIQQGIQQGEAKRLVENIMSLQTKLNLSTEEACKILDVSCEQYQAALKLAERK